VDGVQEAYIWPANSKVNDLDPTDSKRDAFVVSKHAVLVDHQSDLTEYAANHGGKELAYEYEPMNDKTVRGEVVLLSDYYERQEGRVILEKLYDDPTVCGPKNNLLGFNKGRMATERRALNMDRAHEIFIAIGEGADESDFADEILPGDGFPCLSGVSSMFTIPAMELFGGIWAGQLS
jgi:hypothetical protein